MNLYEKEHLIISKSLICTICFLAIILTGCKKEDSAIFQTHITDKNNTLESPSEDMTTDKAIDTPITIRMAMNILFIIHTIQWR